MKAPCHAVPRLAAALVILVSGATAVVGQFSRSDAQLRDGCRALVNQFGPGWDLAALPASFKEKWAALDCDAAWPGAMIPTSKISSSSHRNAAGAARGDRAERPGRGRDEDAAMWPTETEADMAMGMELVCKKPCADSWSPGVWAQHCEQDQQCVFNFVPEGQDCMYEIFSQESTAACMRNKWLVLLGSSGKRRSEM